MHKFTTTLLLASSLVAGAMAAPSIFAQGSPEPSGSMMDHGMMGNKDTKDQGGMMGMTRQMSGMMDHCNGMMNSRRPNDQWRRNAPTAPDKRG
jgi:hypothetical protein